MLKKSSTKTKPTKEKPTTREAKPIGEVTHYYGNLKVAIIKFNKIIKKGIVINIKGATTDFEQKINSMQYDHKDVAAAKKGQEIGIKVKDKVRDGDDIFLVE